MKKIMWLLLSFLLAFTGVLFAKGGAFDDNNFGATIYLTTDYVSRGISYSHEDPAIQGTFDYAHPCGGFAGIWASSWDDGGYSNDIELGYYAGYAGAVGNLDYSLSANYYNYPGAKDDGAEFDYIEFVGSASHTIESPLPAELGLGISYSPEYSGEEGTMLYNNFIAEILLPKSFSLGFEVGRMDVDGDKTTGNGMGLDGQDGYDYIHWRVGISSVLKGFGLDLSYHSTNEKEFFEHFYGFDAGGDRIVFTMSRGI